MKKSDRYFPGLDALRGVAIILVILFHYFSFPIGWIGVDLFFVLSGFLITKSLLETRENEKYFKNFFIRRSLRIAPLYFLVLIIFFTVSPFTFSQKGTGTVYTYYTENQLWFWTFLQNWLIISKGLPPEPYLQHFWSLAVEEQFYLVWPFLIYGIKSVTKLKSILLLMIVLTLALRTYLWFETNPKYMVYYNTFTRLDSISAGALLAVIVKTKSRIAPILSVGFIILFAFLVLATIAFEQSWQHDSIIFGTIGYTLVALFFMTICQYVGLSNSFLSTLKFIRSTGRISYGLYVFHVPILLLISRATGKQIVAILNNDIWAKYSVQSFSLLVTVILSIFSFRFFETPFLKLKSRFK